MDRIYSNDLKWKYIFLYTELITEILLANYEWAYENETKESILNEKIGLRYFKIEEIDLIFNNAIKLVEIKYNLQITSLNPIQYKNIGCFNMNNKIIVSYIYDLSVYFSKILKRDNIEFEDIKLPEYAKEIKTTIKEDNFKKNINKLELELELDKLNTKLSKLVDMKLEGIIDKDIYTKKEQEIKYQIDEINEKIIDLKNQENKNNTISKKIKEIEKIVNAPTSLKEFDKETFDSIVERIVIGDNDSDEQVIRFILKTGVEYKCKENKRIDTSMSFGNYKRFG